MGNGSLYAPDPPAGETGKAGDAGEADAPSATLDVGGNIGADVVPGVISGVIVESVSESRFSMHTFLRH